MKSFTKLYVLMLAMLVSFGTIAQSDLAIQYERQQLESQRWLEEHGPTIEVPSPSSREVTAAGDDCSDPIPITISSGMPTFSTSDGTCGRGDDYEFTCMNSYDGGEDIHYVLTVTEPMWINILFDPVETYSGIALKTDCGDGGTCLFTYGEYANTLKDIKYELLIIAPFIKLGALKMLLEKTSLPYL